VTIQPIPLNNTPLTGVIGAYSTPGYDTGSPGGSFTAWSTTLGVMIPNNGQVILVWWSGGTAPGVTQVLVGDVIAGNQVLPPTTYSQSLGGSSSGWLGPWSPATFNQSNPTGVTYSGGTNTQALVSAAQGCVVVDFTTITTLAVRAYTLIPVSP